MYTYINPFNSYQGTSSTGAQMPSAQATYTAPTVVVPPPASLPDMSLKGQTWGWVIPITAGKRTIPGRPVWRRIRKGTYNGLPSYFLDCAISYGWRAEMIADDDPVTLSFKKLIINGIIVKDVDTGVTAPGVTVTFYDGTQTTADPFMASVDGADDVPAYVYHIVTVIQNLPLLQFGNASPDSFACEVADSGPSMTLDRAFTLLADLTRDLKGKVTIGANITDPIDNLFITEQGSFLTFAQGIGRLLGCDVRENNDAIQIVRAEDGDVNLTLTTDDMLRAPGDSALTFSRIGDDQLPSEIRAQFIASEASFKFSERPARRDFGPMATSNTTRAETIRVPLGMSINQGQTYASYALYRLTEARDSVTYKLPWLQAMQVQPGDIHIVPDDDVTLTIKVARADVDEQGIVSITGQRLRVMLDYDGQADSGSGGSAFVAIPTYQIAAPSIASGSGVPEPTIANAA